MRKNRDSAQIKPQIKFVGWCSIIVLLLTMTLVTAAHADLTTGLVGHWNFDEGNGTTVGDSVNSNTGTLLNGPAWTAGKVGSGALQFDGINDYGTIADSTSLSSMEGSNQATISYWVKRNSTTATMGMISQRQLISIYSNSNFSVRAEWRYGGSGNVGTTLDHPCSSSICLLPPNEWHHVVVTYNSPTSSIYIDGQLKSQKDGAGGALNLNNSNPLEIGRYSTFYFNGSIDDVRIYNRVLTVDEIRALCGQATGGCPVVPSTPTTPTTPTPPSTPTVPTTYTVKQDGSGNYTTIQACANAIKAGDTCEVYPGNYNERVTTRNGGSSSNPSACAPFSGTFPNYTANSPCNAQRITFKAMGTVTMQGFVIQHPFVTVDGFKMTGNPSTNNYISIATGADYCTVTNNTVHDGLDGIYGILFTGAANNCSITNNRFERIRYVFVTTRGHGHLFEKNTFILPPSSLGETDFVRPFGDNIVFRQNTFIGDGTNTPGGHADFVQVFGTAANSPSFNILFEKNWIQDVNIAMGQLNSGGGALGLAFTNIIHDWVFRNNVMVSISGNASTSIPAIRWEHNTFYRAAYNQAGISVGGTLNRGDSSDNLLQNNAFISGGNTADVSGSISGFYGLAGMHFTTEVVSIFIANGDSVLTKGIMSDLVSNGYLLNSNGFITSKAKSLTDISQFAIGSAYQEYKSVIYDKLIQTAALDTNVINTFYADYNFVAGSANAGFPPKKAMGCDPNAPNATYSRSFAFCEPHGINGGDPRLTNINDPDGADNIPFTLDDGLKPLPGSLLCAKGKDGADIGAYSCDPTQVFANITTSAVWYVDNAVPTSGDGKSWERAWKSFSNISWTNIKPGDTIYISGGPSGTEKIYQENFVIKKGGEVGTPITFAIDATNNQHNGKVVFDFNHLGESANVTVILLAASNLVFDGNVKGQSHFEIRNLFNTTSRSAGIGFNGNAVQNVIFRYLTFTNINLPIRLTSSSNIEVHHSRFKGVRGDAAIFLTEPVEGWDVNRVHDNDIEILYNNGGPDGIQGGGSLSIYRNKFRVSKTDSYTSTQHTDTLQVAGNYLKIYDNEFVNVGDSVVSPGSWGDNEHRHDIWVFNNIFRIEEALDPYPQYFRIYNNVGKILSYKNLKILNNTFVGNEFQPIWVGYGQSVQPTGSENEIKNNIFQNSGGPYYFRPIWNIEPSSGYDSKSWTISNNVYFHPSGVSYVTYLGSSYKAVDWIASSENTGSVNSVKFVRYIESGVDNDFHLPASDVIARDRGVNLTSLCNQVPELCQDKDGIARPATGSWDIGAYQYTSNLLKMPYGDISGDSKVTMYDAALVLRYTLGLSFTDAQRKEADVNGDKNIDGKDVIAIVRKALGL